MNLIFTILFLFISGTVFAQECTQPSCFQPRDKELTGLANLVSAPDKVPYYIDVDGNMALANFTSFGRSLVGAANASDLIKIIGILPSGSGHIIEEEGTPLAQRANMNFTGAGVTATDAGGKTVITIPGASGGHVIREDGADLPAQPNLNFVGTGMTCVNDPGASETECTVTGGHIIKNEGTGLPQQPNLNFIGSGVNCVNNAGASGTDCTISAGAEADTVVGAVNGIVKSNGSATFAAAVADVDYARADTDTKALADNSTAGFWAAATNVARSMATADTNNLTWTNPAGVAGNPTIAIGPNVALTSRPFTAGNFDYNFGSAASWTMPIAAGASPSAIGRCAYDSTANRVKCYMNASVFTLATTADIQPLDTELTQIGALVPIANDSLIYTGTTWGRSVVPSCSGAGQSVNFDTTTHQWGCITSAGSISGLTIGKLPKAASSSTLTDSIISEAASVATVAGSLVVGTGPYLILSTEAITASDKTWTVQNTSGLMLPCDSQISNYTDAHVLKVVKVGSIVTCADGGAAGAGTWTDTSVSDGTHKTLNAEGTGNVFTRVSVMQLDFAACPDGATPGLLWNADGTGLGQPAAACNDTGILQRPSADFSGSATNALTTTFRLPKGWTGNIDIKLRYVTTSASPTGNTRWEFSTLCRGLTETWDAATFNTAQGVTDAVAAQYVLNDVTQAALTTTNCAAEEDLTLRVARIGADGADTNDDLATALYALITLRWVEQAQ